MKPIALTKQIKQNKTIKHGNLLLFRDSDNNLRTLPSHCKHLGMSLSGIKPVNNSVTCNYHGWSFCADYAEQQGIFEYAGVVWEDVILSEEQGLPTTLLSNLQSDKWRQFKIKTNWRHLLSNLCDYSHFHVVHKSLGGKGLSKPTVNYIGRGMVDVVWETSLSRPAISEVQLFLGCRGMVSRVPFFDTWLNNISFVVEVNETESLLFTNHWFEKECYAENPWIRFWTNRIVDLLVYEDKKILEKIPPQKPLLQNEYNPLIKMIYNEFHVSKL